MCRFVCNFTKFISFFYQQKLFFSSIKNIATLSWCISYTSQSFSENPDVIFFVISLHPWKVRWFYKYKLRSKEKKGKMDNKQTEIIMVCVTIQMVTCKFYRIGISMLYQYIVVSSSLTSSRLVTAVIHEEEEFLQYLWSWRNARFESCIKDIFKTYSVCLMPKSIKKELFCEIIDQLSSFPQSQCRVLEKKVSGVRAVIFLFSISGY